MSNLKYGAKVKRYRDGFYAVVDATGAWWWSGRRWLAELDEAVVGVFITADSAASEFNASCTTPPPTYTAPHVEVKPDPWPSMMAKLTDAMNRLCDAAEQMKKERDEAVAERDAARAEVARLKEERK